jgi:MFS family permease
MKQSTTTIKGLSFAQAARTVIVRDRFFRHWWQLVKHFSKQLWWTYALLFGTAIIMQLGLFFLPLYAQTRDFSFMDIGIMVLLMNIPALLSMVIGDMTDHIGRALPLGIGLSVAVLGLLGLAQWSDQPWQLIGWAVLFMSSYCFINPALNSFMSRHAPPHSSGTTSAMADGTLMVASMIFAPVIGWLIDVLGWNQMFIVIAIGCCVMTVLAWLSWKQLHRHRSSASVVLES